MPNWNDVLKEISKESSVGPIDKIRRRYMKNLYGYTGRNVIAYYSGWLHRDPRIPNLGIGDEDKNSFMTSVHKLDRTKGLDLILHTPGGNIAATESLVNYLRSMFGNDIRAIVPQLAMSAGTMISCSCKEIIMGKQSDLGPIDPQVNGMSAPAVIAEFQQAIAEVTQNPACAPVWQAVIGKYHPTFLGDCGHAIKWSKEMVEEWLKTGMFNNDPNKNTIVTNIVNEISDHALTKSHSRHLSAETCSSVGLKITALESDPKLQDLVLTIHHAYMHTFSQTAANKIVENHKGAAIVLMG